MTFTFTQLQLSAQRPLPPKWLWFATPPQWPKASLKNAVGLRSVGSSEASAFSGSKRSGAFSTSRSSGLRAIVFKNLTFPQVWWISRRIPGNGEVAGRLLPYGSGHGPSPNARSSPLGGKRSKRSPVSCACPFTAKTWTNGGQKGNWTMRRP